MVCDDQACLHGLKTIWSRLELVVPEHTKIVRIGITLGDITKADTRQLDMLLDDDTERRQWERISKAIDALNRRYSKSSMTFGPWQPLEGGHLGGKISYTRIPSAEDFW